MNASGHLPVSESAARVRAPKAKRKARPKGKATTSASTNHKETAAVGSLTRTKALLLAALKVWELKHRIRD